MEKPEMILNDINCAHALNLEDEKKNQPMNIIFL
jgi:hypothetical protein